MPGLSWSCLFYDEWSSMHNFCLACLSMRTTTLMPRFSLSWIFYNDGNHTWIYRVIALLRRAGLGSSTTNGNHTPIIMVLVHLCHCMTGSHHACSSMRMTTLMPVFSWSQIFYDEWQPHPDSHSHDSSMTNGNSTRTLMILVCLRRCMPGSHCACSSMRMTSLMPVFSWSWIFYDEWQPHPDSHSRDSSMTNWSWLFYDKWQLHADSHGLGSSMPLHSKLLSCLFVYEDDKSNAWIYTVMALL